MPTLHAQSASLNVFVNTGDFTVYNSLAIITSSFHLPKSFAHGVFVRLSDTQGNTNPPPGLSNRVINYGHHTEGFRTSVPILTWNNNLPNGNLVSRSLYRANHAEGINTSTYYRASHAEGFNNRITIGISHHVEGMGNWLFGNSSSPNTVPAIDESTNATRVGTHLEGSGSTVQGSYTHIEGAGHAGFAGNNALRLYMYTHIEGFGHRGLVGNSSYMNLTHFEGARNSPLGNLGSSGTVHIEGIANSGSGQREVHIQGFRNSVPSFNSRGYHVEGQENLVQGITFNVGVGSARHVEGYQNRIVYTGTGTVQAFHIEGHANGNLGANFINFGHAEGYRTRLNGDYVHASGFETTASQGFSGGRGTRSVTLPIGASFTAAESTPNQFIVGQFNTSSYYQSFPVTPATGSTMYFSVGGGVSNTQRADIFTTYLQKRTNNALPAPIAQILLPGVLNSGPYVDDTAAATGGVPLGGLYRLADGIENNILQIRVS